MNAKRSDLGISYLIGDGISSSIEVLGRSAELIGNLQSVFTPSNAQLQPVTLLRSVTEIGRNTVFSYEENSGLRASYAHSAPEDDTTSPPGFENQLQLRVEDPANSGWLALVTKIDAAEILLAKDFYWELAANSSVPLQINFDLRFHNHGGEFSENRFGFIETSSEPTSFSGSLLLEDITRPADAVEATLHLFFSLQAPFDASFDYIIAHYG